jgi:hypothetical protein
MTTKKLSGKLAAGVRKVKEPTAAPPATPRQGRVAAGRPAPHAGMPANTLSGSGADLHPVRIWPD